MRLIPKLEISSDSTVETIPDARELFVRDLDAPAAGAPQNVGLIHEIISSFSGQVIVDAAVRLVHVAELLLGLGAARVVVRVKDVATQLALRHFATRFGDAVIYAGSADDLMPLDGSPMLLLGGSPEKAQPLRASELLLEPDGRYCNPCDWEAVGVSGLIVEIGHHHKNPWIG